MKSLSSPISRTIGLSHDITELITRAFLINAGKRRDIDKESLEYDKEVSTSNSNLVLTTAEIHPAPNVRYAKNVLEINMSLSNLKSLSAVLPIGKERIPIPTVQFTVRPSRPLLAQVGPNN